jgi:hypothetical protein
MRVTLEMRVRRGEHIAHVAEIPVDYEMRNGHMDLRDQYIAVPWSMLGQAIDRGLAGLSGPRDEVVCLLKVRP